MKKLPEPTFVYDPSGKQSKQPRRLNKKIDTLTSPPKRPKRWKKVLLICFITLVSLGVAFGIYLFLHVSKITSNPFTFTQKLKGEDSGRVNILLLGIGDPGHDGENLSDTNIILSIDTRNHQAAMISIPRDTRVKIPGHGYDKINAAHSYGQIPLAVNTIEQNFGIDINYYVRANFTGLKQVVDAVGGIDVDNKTLLSDPEYPCDKNQYKSCGFKLTVGQHHLDGTTALKYARCRKGTCGNDFGRDARQQEVLQKVATKALTLQSVINPGRFNSLLSSVSDNIKTDLSLSEMKRLYDLSKQVDQSKTISIVLSTDTGGLLTQSTTSSDLVPSDGDFTQIKALVTNVFKVGPIFSEKPVIAIQNGTTTVGLGGKLNTKIESDGYPITISAVTNALRRDYTATQIIDYSGGTKPNTVNYLQNLLGVTATTPEKPLKPGYDILVIIGSDYAAKQSPTSSSQNSQ